MYVMKPYDDALKLILEEGTWKSNKRTGVRTKAVCGILSRYKIDEYFPVLTRRKVWPKAIFGELLWFISGSTNNTDLQNYGSNIWTPWVSTEFEKKHGYAQGSFGPVYGFQLRHFGGFYGNGIGGDEFTDLPHRIITMECNSGGSVWYEKETRNVYGFGGFDQLAYMVNRIKEDPSCRRILFSLWNPAVLDKMRLPPCHYTFQVFIDDEGRMTGELTQRSCDFPIGVPANIQFYSTLIYMLAQQTGYKPYEFVHNTVDSHIYENQIEQVKEYLETPIIGSPKFNLKKAKDIFSYSMDDFELVDFKCGPKISIQVAV